MRRVLFVIPHFYASGNGFYGSTGSDVEVRVRCLERVISGLHQSLGSRQAFLLWLRDHVPGTGNGHLIKTNEPFLSDLDITICTSGDRHLLQHGTLSPSLYQHLALDTEPMKLGFACHEVLRRNLGKYDWYCYLEDDLLISDTLFFSKLEWFIREFGEEATLSPHRFERSMNEPVHKLYHDGLVRPDFTAAWQDITDRQYFSSEQLGMNMRFERWPNPHSGCFFLNARQMEQWASKPFFGDCDSSFAGPLESAASLGIIKTFRQYKPSPVNAAFLELEHLHSRYLGEALKFE
jgi:hypothetical protein